MDASNSALLKLAGEILDVFQDGYWRWRAYSPSKRKWEAGMNALYEYESILKEDISEPLPGVTEAETAAYQVMLTKLQKLKEKLGTIRFREKT